MPPGKLQLLPLRRVEVRGPRCEAALLSVLRPVVGLNMRLQHEMPETDLNGSDLSARIWSAVQLQRGESLHNCVATLDIHHSSISLDQ